MRAPSDRRRVVIESVKPEIDCGRFPIKRTVGEAVTVEADVFADGHDELACLLLYRREADRRWFEVPMTPLGNDRWQANFTVNELTSYRYTVEGWVDHFKTWRIGLEKKTAAGQDVRLELLEGATLIDEASARASARNRRRLERIAGILRDGDQAQAVAAALDLGLAGLVALYPDRAMAIRYGRELEAVVDRELARFGAWYEMFPRSATPVPGKHGTFKDCEELLPYVADMGFDVLYLPPIHPIGRSFRKGKNNTLAPQPDDPGSPWAIGAPEGGHKSVHPELGTLDDFRRFLRRAAEHGIEIALDIAFQASPDHPYVKEHPEWFRRRPDGSIQYAENPPKRYQDIYPFSFDSEHSGRLQEELKSIIQFWIDQGVRIFRVDNPHTKSFGFWEWAIREIKIGCPEAIFLSEAFTRPKVMYRLAKLGFTQSYTYFAWRNARWEIEQYFTELTGTDVREFFRPNLWPNTPDILTEYLQAGGRPAFVARLILAATLGASYGIYGPPFELMVNQPRERGSEEYLDSEKYEIKRWDRDRPDSLRDLIGRVNRIRRENPALQQDRTLRFHRTDNDQLICYSKRTDDRSNAVLVAVNLDSQRTHAGWVYLDLEDLGLKPHEPFQVHDLLTDARYIWHGPRNYIQLHPHTIPAHVFRIRRRVHTERDFEYYM